MYVATMKSQLASVYDIPKMTVRFVRGIAADDSEKYHSSIARFLRNNRDVNPSTREFWQGIYNAVIHGDDFLRNTEKVKRSLLSLDCTVVSDEVDIFQKFRKITVDTPKGFKVVCHCNLISGQSYITLKKEKEFSDTTHRISRFDRYYVNRALQSIYSH